MSFRFLGQSVRRINGKNASKQLNAASRRMMIHPEQLALARSRLMNTRTMSVLNKPMVINNNSNIKVVQVRSFSSGTPEVVPVPSMGDSISEGTVVEWVKAPGDFVEVDEVVVVLETDKVSVDVRSPVSGVLAETLAKIDESVIVGAPLFKINKQEGSATPAAASKAVSTPAAAPASGSGEQVPVNVPSMGDSISEGTIVTVFKNVGDVVRADEPVLVIETDKVSVDVNAPFAGKITSLTAKLDEVVQVGTPLFVLEKGDFGGAVASTPVAAVPAASAPTPAASAPVAEAPKKAAASKPAAAAAPKAEPAASAGGRFSRKETRVGMSFLKIRAAQRQKDTQNSAAMLSTFQECDLGNLMALREDLDESFEKTHGVKLGFMSSFLKASAMALQKVPAVNAFIDMDQKEIVYNEFVDINVAVASDKGVVVPVLRNVERMSLPTIEKNLLDLSQQARDGTLAVEDLAGGTFTINNSAVHGSLLSTSMLVAPQSAILGLHGIKERPAFHNGKVVPRPMMFLSLTYDHRIIDGREAVTFLKSISDSIGDPRRMLVEL